MSEPLSAIAARLAAALRSSPDRCIRNYDMKVVSQCSRCTALAEYDAHQAIVQTPENAAKAAKGERHD
jgi:hypothetical protein